MELGHGGGAAVVAIALVLFPGGAGDEQGRGVDRERHVGEIGLGDGIVGERAIAELARGREGNRLVERAAGEAERGGGDGDAEQGQGLHRDLEALAGVAEHGAGGEADVGQLEAGERVRGDRLDPLGDLEPGVSPGRMKAEMPRAPSASPVRAKRVMTSAIWPLEM